jgi:hypothetical protein
VAVIPELDEANLQAICDMLGSTDPGLTGFGDRGYLRECGCPDPIPQMTKRNRLYAALLEKQEADRCSNNIVAFINCRFTITRFRVFSRRTKRSRIRLRKICFNTSSRMAFDNLPLCCTIHFSPLRVRSDPEVQKANLLYSRKETHLRSRSRSTPCSSATREGFSPGVRSVLGSSRELVLARM